MQSAQFNFVNIIISSYLVNIITSSLIVEIIGRGATNCLFFLLAGRLLNAQSYTGRDSNQVREHKRDIGFNLITENLQ
jgi:hypothetical protein